MMINIYVIAINLTINVCVAKYYKTICCFPLFGKCIFFSHIIYQDYGFSFLYSFLFLPT